MGLSNTLKTYLILLSIQDWFSYHFFEKLNAKTRGNLKRYFNKNCVWSRLELDCISLTLNFALLT